MEVPAWLQGGPEPRTVSETIFRADRLKTMRMRLSAAYKGMNALLMKEGAQDFRSGQRFVRVETPYKGSYFGLATSGEAVLAYGLRGNACKLALNLSQLFASFLRSAIGATAVSV